MEGSMNANVHVMWKSLLMIACLCSICEPSTYTSLAFVPGFGGKSLATTAHSHGSSQRSLGNITTTTKLAASSDSEQSGSGASDSESNSNGDAETGTGTGTINPLRLAVLKLGLTELRYTSPLNYEKRSGSYNCANCGSTLFDSSGKYDSGSGWPSFWKTSAADRVAYKREWDGRVEVSCKNCGGHLGHAFPDGPRRNELSEELLMTVPQDDLPTSSPDNPYTRMPRYCVNGASLKFKESDD